MRYAYPCILEPEAEGGFSVSFPDVPGALTCGDSRTEALVRAEDALVGALGAHFSLRGAIPLPSPVQEGQELVALRPVAAAKVALYTAMREQGLTNVALGERLGVSEAAVRKLLNPDHRSHLSTIEKALHAVGLSLVVETVPWPPPAALSLRRKPQSILPILASR